jgi:hypothetical protein
MLDTVKHPDLFPSWCKFIIAQPKGTWLILTFRKDQKRKAQVAARVFRCFRKSLRTFPDHPLAKEELNYQVRTAVKMEEFGQVYNLYLVKKNANSK